MEELKQKLLAVCNESNLPLEAIMYVTKDLWRDVEDTFRSLQREQQKQVEVESDVTEE
jgi:hypothetical protein